VHTVYPLAPLFVSLFPIHSTARHAPEAQDCILFPSCNLALISVDTIPLLTFQLSRIYVQYDIVNVYSCDLLVACKADGEIIVCGLPCTVNHGSQAPSCGETPAHAQKP